MISVRKELSLFKPWLYHLLPIPDFYGAIRKLEVPQLQSFTISATFPFLLCQHLTV